MKLLVCLIMRRHTFGTVGMKRDFSFRLVHSSSLFGFVWIQHSQLAMIRSVIEQITYCEQRDGIEGEQIFVGFVSNLVYLFASNNHCFRTYSCFVRFL